MSFEKVMFITGIQIEVLSFAPYYRLKEQATEHRIKPVSVRVRRSFSVEAKRCEN
jgi:hypothetical protein